MRLAHSACSCLDMESNSLRPNWLWKSCCTSSKRFSIFLSHRGVRCQTCCFGEGMDGMRRAASEGKAITIVSDSIESVCHQ